MLDNIQKMHRQSDVCILCSDPSCSGACPYGMDPGKIMRKLRFENELGAVRAVKENYRCENCDAPCENACVLNESIHIKETMKCIHEQDVEVREDLDIDLSCEFCGVRLENPFLLSSSIVSSSYEKISRAFEAGWAGACYKTICDFIPNETSPRYSALGDSYGIYGFKNIEQLSTNTADEDYEIISRLKKQYPEKVIFASVMGRNAKEWAALTERADKAGADVIELNFSCPNMEEKGLGIDIGQDEKAIIRFTSACRAVTDKPVLAKMTPNVADMRPLALAAVRGGADGIAEINTIQSLLKMDIDTFTTGPEVNGLSSVGGYSGKAVHPIAMKFTYELCSCPELEGVSVSAMGGIESWKDALAFIVAGANHVQITTAVMQYGQRIIEDLIEGLKLYMSSKGFKKIDDFRGAGIKHVADLDRLERDVVEYPKFIKKDCLLCGRCAVSCMDGGHEALKITDGKLILDPLRCVGCHLCVLVCPNGAVAASGRRIKKDI